MKYKLFSLVLIFYNLNCHSQTKSFIKNLKKIKIDTLLTDKISIRAIIIDNDKVYYGADKNRFGSVNWKTKNKSEIKIKNDSLNLEFRSIAQTDNYVFVLSISTPAYLYKISKFTNNNQIVYQELNSKVFYDAMQFYDNKNGIAVGDATNNCLSVITTHDGGSTWQKSICSNAPKNLDEEALFAASNTNIVIKKNKTWIVTGGKSANVFVSKNKGESWIKYETPIVQGEAMSGIFSADFFDCKNGIIVGGNYNKPSQNYGNKAITCDGGKTWKLIAENKYFGYASCIQYFPNSKGKKLVCVGASGIYVSNNFAKNWIKLSDYNSLYTIKFIDKNTAIAAGKNIMLKMIFE